VRGKYLAVAKEAALRAGRFLMENLGKSEGVIYKGAGHFNPVSAMDTGAERIIVDAVGSAFPQHNIVTEEKGRQLLNLTRPQQRYHLLSHN